MSKLTALILAGGRGVRMKSELPKVLHDICGKPMIMHVMDQLYSAGLTGKDIFVITGPEQAAYKSMLAGVNLACQKKPLGTGDALRSAWPMVRKKGGTLMVLPADHPLLSNRTMKSFLGVHTDKKPVCSMLTAIVKNPTKLGRVTRNGSGMVSGIVEEKDATPEERMIKEVNRGTYLFDMKALARYIPRLKKSVVTGEYYLTDVIKMMVDDGLKVVTSVLEDNDEMATVNDRFQFSHVEKVMRRKICEVFMDNGVTIVDPDNVYIDKDVQIGRDSIIYPYTFLSGQTHIGKRCRIGPMAEIRDCRIEDDVVARNSYFEGSRIRKKASVQSYSHIRAGCDIGEGVRIGNFVELKKAVIGNGSTIKHFCYIGDASVGREVNVDAGTVTVNFDRVTKHRTTIRDKAFIGGGSVLVAPIEIGKEAYIEAGSVIARNTRVPAGSHYLGLPVAGQGEKKKPKGKVK